MNYHHYNPRAAALENARALLENAAAAAMALRRAAAGRAAPLLLWRSRPT